MSYIGIPNQKEFHIDHIYSVHYFEYASNFSFPGESHDFWELVYVDKGQVKIASENDTILLDTNDIFFHQPNEFHTVYTDGITAPNAIIISFSCDDESMHFFKKRKMRLDEAEQFLLGRIISEARLCFDCHLGDPYLKSIPLKDSAPRGAIQLIFAYLEQFLIQILRKNIDPQFQTTQPELSDLPIAKQRKDLQLFNDIVKYIQKNIHATPKVPDICDTFSISASRLQKLFKRCCNLGINEYASYLKIERAKEMIRESHTSFTQISEELGYSSIHYFSRQFKKVSGMTPSEYASSVKLMSEQD